LSKNAENIFFCSYGAKKIVEARGKRREAMGKDGFKARKYPAGP